MQTRIDDYLGRLAFREGEYESLQQEFDVQVDRLAGFLEGGIEARLLAQVRNEVGSAWATSIGDVAEGLLQTVLPAGPVAPAMAEAQERLRQEAQQALLHGGWLDATAVKQEAQACSREASHLVLARWFEIVHAALGRSGQMALTMNVLPEGMTLHEALSEIDLDAHGIDNLTIAAGWRSYWDQQRRAFRTDWVPIRLGALFLVPERAAMTDGYRIFSESSDAWELAAHQCQAWKEEEKSKEEEDDEAKRLRRVVSTAVAAFAGRFRSSVTAHVRIAESSRSRCLAMGDVWTRAFDSVVVEVPELKLGLVSVENLRSTALGIFSADSAAPERQFAEIVGQSIDAMFACSLSPGSPSTEDLVRRLEISGGRLRQVLAEYAGSRDLKISEAADLFTASVVGSWAQSIDPAPLGKACVFDPGVFLYEPGETTDAGTVASVAHKEAAATAYIWSNGFDELYNHPTDAARPVKRKLGKLP
jgi:hypothetical protein